MDGTTSTADCLRWRAAFDGGARYGCLLPVLENHHASVVTLDFDGRVAWPVYDWMGVAKAALA